MAAAKPCQPLAGQFPQPGVERQPPLGNIVGQLANGFHERLLYHVGRIHAGRQARVHADRDHPPKSRPAAVEEPLHRAPFPLAARRSSSSVSGFCNDTRDLSLLLSLRKLRKNNRQFLQKLGQQSLTTYNKTR